MKRALPPKKSRAARAGRERGRELLPPPAHPPLAREKVDERSEATFPGRAPARAENGRFAKTVEAAPRCRPIKHAPPEALGKALKTPTREGENRLASEPAGGRTPRRPTSDPRNPRPTAVRRIGRRRPQPPGSSSSDKTTDHHDHPRARCKSSGPLLDFGRPTLFRVLKQLARAHLAAPAPARPRAAGPAPLASPAHLTGRHDTACQAACSSAHSCCGIPRLPTATAPPRGRSSQNHARPRPHRSPDARSRRPRTPLPPNPPLS